MFLILHRKSIRIILSGYPDLLLVILIKSKDDRSMDLYTVNRH